MPAADRSDQAVVAGMTGQEVACGKLAQALVIGTPDPVVVTGMPAQVAVKQPDVHTSVVPVDQRGQASTHHPPPNSRYFEAAMDKRTLSGEHSPYCVGNRRSAAPPTAAALGYNVVDALMVLRHLMNLVRR